MRGGLMIGLLVLLCLVAARAVEAKVFLFDMGTEKSELRSGFTRITAASLYEKEVGYGWKSTDGLKEHHRHYSRQWQYNESRGRTRPPQIYTNEITCDTVFSEKANSFLVDLAPGEYTVYLLCGRSAGSAHDYHYFEAAVGESRSTVKIPGPYIFEKLVFKASVGDAPLSIDFHPKTDWLVASLIVFPAAQEQEVRRSLLDALEKEVYFLPPDVAEQWKETKHADDRPAPEFSDGDRKRGYAVFARHYAETIYPNTVPRQRELNPELAVFASLGEYEPVTFTVFPFKSLSRAEVTVSDLRSGDSVISTENVDVRYVRYMLVRDNISGFFSYHIAPDVLEHKDFVEIKQGCNQRCWITIKVPENADPGVYRGKLTFRPAAAPPADVKLKIRVLPIELQKSPEHVYGMYYRDPLCLVHESNPPYANEYFRKKAEMERRDMVEHGMNSHISHISHISKVTGLARDNQGKWTTDGTETERRIATDRRFGLASRPLVVHIPVDSWYAKLVDKRGTGNHLRLVRPDVPESFFGEVTEMVKAVEKEKRKYDWPEFLYYPIDEPSTEEKSVRFMVNVLRAVKKVPGVRTYVTADPSHDQFEPMWPYVDVWCCQPFVFGCEKIRQLSNSTV